MNLDAKFLVTDPADLTNAAHPAYWPYRKYCDVRGLHYTEVWYPAEVEGFTERWNALFDRE